jgi:hypothetical protein
LPSCGTYANAYQFQNGGQFLPWNAQESFDPRSQFRSSRQGVRHPLGVR